MKHEIFDTQSIWEYVHSEENKKDIAEMNGMEVDEVSDESLWEDERFAYDSEKEYLASEIKAFIKGMRTGIEHQYQILCLSVIGQVVTV